jgi:transposase
MARSLDVDWQDDAEALCQHYLESKDHQDRQRMQLLWLMRDGKTLKEAARTVGAGYRTAQNWIGWYRSGGA